MQMGAAVPMLLIRVVQLPVEAVAVRTDMDNILAIIAQVTIFIILIRMVVMEPILL
jgi:hypothetical protein